MYIQNNQVELLKVGLNVASINSNKCTTVVAGHFIATSTCTKNAEFYTLTSYFFIYV